MNRSCKRVREPRPSSAWIASLFGQKPAAEPPPREIRHVTDVQYEVIEKKDDAPR